MFWEFEYSAVIFRLNYGLFQRFVTVAVIINGLLRVERISALRSFAMPTALRKENSTYGNFKV